jgi:hypothetical protein
LKHQLSKVADEAREIIYKNLNADKANRAKGVFTDWNLLKSIFVDLELINFFIWAAEYKPYYLLEEEGQGWNMAQKVKGQLVRLLKKTKGEPA